MKQTHEHPIMRRHRMITKGISEDKADDLVTSVAHSLQSLAKPKLIGSCTCGPCTRGEPCLGAQSHINRLRQAPPAKEDIKSLLARASQIAKSFGPIITEQGTATLNQEAA